MPKRRVETLTPRMKVPPLSAFGGDRLAQKHARQLINAWHPEHFHPGHASLLVAYGLAFARIIRASELNLAAESPEEAEPHLKELNTASSQLAALSTKLRINPPSATDLGQSPSKRAGAASRAAEGSTGARPDTGPTFGVTLQ